MHPPLHTLSQPVEQSFDIRRSRFVVRAIAVQEAAQALAFFQAQCEPEATHNCWAYRIGQDYRFNDDGEPGGTAGRPILQAIDGQRMDQVAVLVIRWYGGIKLGTGGLARAYGGSAAECLRTAARLPIVPMARLSLRCDFAELPLFHARLRELDAQIEERFDAQGVQLLLQLPASRVEQAQARIVDLSRGRREATRLD